VPTKVLTKSNGHKKIKKSDIKMLNKKSVYFFGNGKSDGDATMKNTLGGKGANLAEMINIKIPVPPGFTIATHECASYYEAGRKISPKLWAEVELNIAKTEKAMGAKFGDAKNPLLFSVRSGARASMPGMMDTVLNLGLDDKTVEGLALRTGNVRFAYDSYRRFIQMFGDVVMKVDHDLFEHALEALKKQKGAKSDTDLSAEDLKQLVKEYKQIVRKALGRDFPASAQEQLKLSIGAVFDSWYNERANVYRRMYGIDESWGTAVNVQAMVFGNMGETSGTGVCFTRNPSTGENKFYGEFLMNAQGEDVVAGIRTPLEIIELKRIMPKAYDELVKLYLKLEKHYKDMQDIEFTIQDKQLFILQTRSGKRTGAAAVRIAVEMVKEKLIDKKTAILRVDPKQLDQLLHPMIDPKAKVSVLATGLPASPGAAVGTVVFSAEEAVVKNKNGEKVILVRTETSPEDISGMDAAQGILTARGGMTSHAAVVARGMGKCCVSGVGELVIDEKSKTMRIGSKTFKTGDFITLNGSSGEVIEGKCALSEPKLSGDFGTLMEWADAHRTLKIRTNGDTPRDAKQARDFGAEGIGLCRTEHMFFEADRILAVREMILSEAVEGRKAALKKILPMQTGDFYQLFKIMDGFPVTIRLLDPPLHEFVPNTAEQMNELSKVTGVSIQKIEQRVKELHEFNPMLGHRGCRLGITFPEIYDMQVEAIIAAACQLTKEGRTVIPEIMIPLIGTVKELEYLKANAIKVILDVTSRFKVKLKYMIGTMIEIPRAALTADKIAAEAEFFSFGTNDLTQMTFGYSRDDSGSFLPDYYDKKILMADPFQTLDTEGVGQLVTTAVQKGRSVRKDLKVGICGEHGGDPKSIEFCHQAGLNYVSCSPYRVPIARLAAAQAALKY